MVTVERSVLVGYAARQMYALVEDIERYPEFLPWCETARIEMRDAGETTATIHLNYHGVSQQFTTRNSQVPELSITMKLVRGPFSRLDGLWRFTVLAEDACKIEFRLDYEFESRLLGKLVGPVFNHIASTFVEAFVRRAEDLYGK
nr:type II toxin-antitoxin system RatA family toxin [Rhodoferax sp.]